MYVSPVEVFILSVAQLFSANVGILPVSSILVTNGTFYRSGRITKTKNDLFHCQGSHLLTRACVPKNLYASY